MPPVIESPLPIRVRAEAEPFEWTWISVARRLLPLKVKLFTEEVTLHDWTNPQKGRLRIFENDFLEALTIVQPRHVLAIYVPLIAWLFWKGVSAGFSGSTLAGLFTGGLFFWTFFEYWMHRLVFHFVPKNEWQIVVAYFIHGVHHSFPEDDRRLVMPPVASLILLMPVWTAFVLVLGGHYGPALAGFLVGYLGYDMTHYAVHALPMRSAWGNWVRKHHMLHHYATPDQRFGVSTPVWDYVFRTAR